VSLRGAGPQRHLELAQMPTGPQFA
jgi:hypothetical protein